MHSARRIQTGDSTAGSTRRRILASLGAPSDSNKLVFPAHILLGSQDFSLLREKIFSSIAHNQQSSKKYFAENYGVDRLRRVLARELSNRFDANASLTRRSTSASRGHFAMARHEASTTLLRSRERIAPRD